MFGWDLKPINLRSSRKQACQTRETELRMLRIKVRLEPRDINATKA